MGSIVIEGMGSGGGGSAPTIVSDVVTSTSIALTFSADMVIIPPIEQPSYWSITGGAPVTITSVTVATNVVTVHFIETAGAESVVLNLPPIGLTDVDGNQFLGPSFLYPFTTVGVPPTIVSMLSLEGRLARIAFSEPVLISDALNKSNYSVNNGLSIVSIVQETATNFILTTSLQVPGQSYLATVSGIHDLAGNLI